MDHSATWFSHANTSGNAAREQLANESLEMLIDWLKESGGNVGIMGQSYLDQRPSGADVPKMRRTPPLSDEKRFAHGSPRNQPFSSSFSNPFAMIPL